MRKGWLALGLMMLGLLTAAFPAVGRDATAKTTLTITGMTCGGCAAGVKIQLKRTEGVTAYEVSFEKGEAEVSYDPAKTTPEKIAASVSKTGFGASVEKAGADKVGDGAVKPPEAAADAACSGASCEQDCCKAARRAATAVQDPEAAGLVSLAHGLAPLATAFNAAKARPRFLAILSPTCGACVHGAEAVKATVLPAGSAVDVFIVWAPMLGTDGAAEASRSSATLVAPQVRQYWDPSRQVGASLRKDIFPDAVERMQRSLPKEHFFEQYLVDRDKNQPEWDIYLFFEPGTEWTDRAPLPSRWVRQTALFPKGEDGKLTSLLWTNDYANAPVEGSLTEQLKRLAARPSARGAVR
jgi:copper chaperone CopZ